MRGSEGLYVRKMPSLVPVQVCLGLVLLLAPSLAGSWDRLGPGGPGSSIVTASLATPQNDCLAVVPPTPKEGIPQSWCPDLVVYQIGTPTRPCPR